MDLVTVSKNMPILFSWMQGKCAVYEQNRMFWLFINWKEGRINPAAVIIGPATCVCVLFFILQARLRT